MMGTVRDGDDPAKAPLMPVSAHDARTFLTEAPFVSQRTKTRLDISR